MKRTRRLEIVVETKRRLTIRRRGAAPNVVCERCEGPMVSAEEAVAFTGLSSRAIHRSVEAGEIHFAETPAGALLICQVSLGGGADGAE